MFCLVIVFQIWSDHVLSLKDCKELGMGSMSVTPPFERWRPEDWKAGLDYILTSRPAWARENPIKK